MYSGNFVSFVSVVFDVLSGMLPCATLRAQEIETGFRTRSEFRIEVFDDSFRQLIDPKSKIQVLATGFKWSEGPLHDKPNQRLLFSDVPNNKIWQINKKNGQRALSIFLDPAGYEGKSPESEPGSNGLALDDQGRLIVCDHGNRRVYRLETDGSKTTLADKCDGKRFNSPNDLVISSNGDIFFTDPPYGLNDKTKHELGCFGVYCLKPDGKILPVTRELVRPNGVTLSPDEKTLYVAQSHSPNPVYMKYAVHDDGTFGKGELLFDAKELAGKDPGMPDGITIDVLGNLWATGPGGVLVISPSGKLLGRVYTGAPTANCAFVANGNDLVMTAGNAIAIVPTKTYGVGDWTGDGAGTLLPREVVDEVSAAIESLQEGLKQGKYAEIVQSLVPAEVLEKFRAEGKLDGIVKDFSERGAKRLENALSNASFPLATYSAKDSKVTFLRYRMDEERGLVREVGLRFQKVGDKWITRF